MTRSIDIDFIFERPLDISVALRVLLEAGLSPSFEGEVAYLIDRDGMFDWQREGVDGLAEVLRELGDPKWRDRVVGITLIFPEDSSGGDLLFHPGRTSTSFVIGVNPKMLPNSSRFCDIGWYLARLVPLFESLGLSEVEARDSS